MNETAENEAGRMKMTEKKRYISHSIVNMQAPNNNEQSRIGETLTRDMPSRHNTAERVSRYKSGIHLRKKREFTLNIEREVQIEDKASRKRKKPETRDMTYQDAKILTHEREERRRVKLASLEPHQVVSEDVEKTHAENVMIEQRVDHHPYKANHRRQSRIATEQRYLLPRREAERRERREGERERAREEREQTNRVKER